MVAAIVARIIDELRPIPGRTTSGSSLRMASNAFESRTTKGPATPRCIPISIALSPILCQSRGQERKQVFSVGRSDAGGEVGTVAAECRVESFLAPGRESGDEGVRAVSAGCPDGDDGSGGNREISDIETPDMTGANAAGVTVTYDRRRRGGSRIAVHGRSSSVDDEPTRGVVDAWPDDGHPGIPCAAPAAEGDGFARRQRLVERRRESIVVCAGLSV
ncbi:MAG: hypothetical protein ABEK29_11785, partial [Bradymonadaceae bacterium]